MAEFAEQIEDQIWYSYHHGEYRGKAPRFYDPETFPWVQKVEDDFKQIKEEVERLLEINKKKMTPYFNESLFDKSKSWSTLAFYFWRIRKHKIINESPILDEMFNSIPGFISSGISKLDPGAEIKWHQGETSGIIRCHFPLKVPGELPDCGLQVVEEQRPWKEGRMLMFCDAHKHRAFNFTKNERWILIIDIVHPKFADRKKSIAANALSILWLQRILQVLPFLSNAPGFVRGIIRYSCKLLIHLYIPLQRKLYF